MKFFLVIACAFSIASADVSHLLKSGGYTGASSYETSNFGGSSGGYGGSSSGFGGSSGGGSARFDSFGGGGAYSGGDSYSGGGGSSFGGGGSSFGGGSSGSLETGQSGFLDYSSGSSGGTARIVKPVVRHGPAIVSKAFYVHTAPEEEARGIEVEEKEHLVHPRKHYNIVFVKTPTAGGSSHSSNNVNVFPENEEKTIVYVLTGKNEGNVDSNGDIVIPQPKAPSKPEVVFVKYNNEADAQRAISDIQGQYNSQQGASVSVIGAGNSFRSGAGGSSGGSSSFSGSSGHSSHSGGSHGGGSFRSGVSTGGSTGGSFSSGGSSGGSFSSGGSSQYTESKPIRSVRYGRQSLGPSAASAASFQIQKSRELAARRY